MIGNDDETTIQQFIEGNFEASFDKYRLNFIGFGSNKSIVVDDISMEINNNQVEVSANFKEIVIR